MTVSIRRATKSDLPVVARLAAELVRLHQAFDPARFFLMEPLEDGYAWFLGRELSDDDAVVLVAERDGEVVGYIYGRLEARDWNALLDACGAVHDIFVAETARRAHVAEALMEAIFRHFRERGAPRVVLHTASQNTPAQTLFERMGFRKTMIEMTKEL
jgi:ribosomal protein S18 acetylase RimI-like enzyme